MARSLFARLARRYGPRVDPEERRQFLKLTLAASAGLLLSQRSLLGMALSPRRDAKRIVVIGAGFAGLACAYELKAAGYDVKVVEARNRVGGRVLSLGDFVPGKNVEGGGEFIGSNHPTWVAYKDKFNLEFLDVSEDEDAEVPIVIEGRRLDTEESKKLYEEMEEALKRMDSDAEKIDADEPWKSENAAALDAKTTKAWIDALEGSPLCRAAVAIELTANNGQEVVKQSYLGNLAQVKGGGLEKYWTETEVYRCKGGNQQLAKMLAESIGPGRVLLQTPVRAVEMGKDGKPSTVKCGAGQNFECDDVVLTVPPSVWGKIEFSPKLPAVIDPQMGLNLKYIAAVKSRFWKEKKLSPDALSDGDVSMTWDATDGQKEGDEACLAVFAGGPAAKRCLEREDDKRKANFSSELERLFPGYGEAVSGATRFMNWPSDPWTGGGYSFPAPGQVTTVGPLMRSGLGNLHFAGEHTCYKFVGYMEGGLNSGVSLAKRIAERDGVVK